VIDKGQLGMGTTRVAAGMLAPIGELAFGEPELLKMTVGAAELYPGFVAELEEASGVCTEYRRDGALHVALDRDEAAELRRVHALQRSLGLEAEWLPPRRCRELEPGLTPSFAGGVHAPHEAAVDPRQLAEALRLACGKERFRYALTAIEGLMLEAGRVVGVRTSGAEWRAGSVVLAAGAWSGQLEWLPEEARPPVRPVKGQILTLRTRDGSAACERIVASERVYLVPRPDGRLLVGATVEEQGLDTAVTAGGVHELLREAYRLLPDVAEMELVETSAGLRPGTPDNLPLIGPGGLDGLIWATGHYRNGILLAPLTGYAVAELLATGESPEVVAAASPRRLGVETAGGVR
jgi:glycine oxidase